MKLTKHESLSRATKQLIFDEPFYGMFLLMLNRKWEPAIGTAAIVATKEVDPEEGKKEHYVKKATVKRRNINYDLVINEGWWDTLSELEQRGLLKHELLHIAFFHMTDYDHIPREHADILNIAMD